MGFDQTGIDTFLEEGKELIRFSDLNIIFEVTILYRLNKTAISTHYLPNQSFNFNKTCKDKLLGEG